MTRRAVVFSLGVTFVGLPARAQETDWEAGEPAPESAPVIEPISPTSGAQPGEPPGPAPDAPSPQVAPSEPEPEPAERTAQGRELGGHRFILPEELANPMMVTSFVFGQGLGSLSFKVRDEMGNAVSGKIFMLTERLAVSVGLWNRVAAELRVTGFAGVGGDLDTVATFGGLAEFGYRIGIKARAFTIDAINVQLSAGTYYRYTQDLAIRPIAIVESAVSEGRLKVLQKSRAEFIEPMLAAAWGFEPLGLQLSLAPSFSMHADRAAHALSVGAAATFDIWNLVRFVPLALNLEFEHSRYLQGEAEPLNAITAGAFYSGRADLQLGVRYYTLLKKAFDLKAASIVMAYFF